MKTKWAMVAAPVVGGLLGLMVGKAAAADATHTQEPPSTVILTERSLVPIGTALGVIGTVVFLTRRVTKWEDAIEANTTKTEALSEEVQKLSKMVMTRPCFKESEEITCPKGD